MSDEEHGGVELPPGPVWTKVDARLRARGQFTYDSIEEELAKEYTIADDVPDVDDDELHYMVSGIHLHYEQLGLAQEGI